MWWDNSFVWLIDVLFLQHFPATPTCSCPLLSLVLTNLQGEREAPGASFLTVFSENLDHGRSHWWGRRKRVLSRQKREWEFVRHIHKGEVWPSPSGDGTLSPLCSLSRGDSTIQSDDRMMSPANIQILSFLSSIKIPCTQHWVTQCYRNLRVSSQRKSLEGPAPKTDYPKIWVRCGL